MPKVDLSPQLDDIISRLSQLEGKEPTLGTIKRLGEVVRLGQRIKREHTTRARPRRVKNTTPSGDPKLVELHERLAVVRDRVCGVAIQGQAGFYLYGRAGTSKTYTVRTTLEHLGIPYEYQNGHITPLGLFETFEEHPDAIIVLDDVGEIFKQPAAKGLLLAALGNQPNGRREVCYNRQGKTVKVLFNGGIIAISNLELHGDELIAAIKSRVQTLNYDPSDEQIVALMRTICSKGFTWMGQRMTPQECHKVCEYLLDRCRVLDIRPDVRMLVDKAFRDYVLWKVESETHWKDLINSALEDRLVELRHPVDIHVPTKREEEAEELDKLEAICKEFEDHERRLTAFMEGTGKSRRTFFRRMGQLKALGRIP